jgi:hypothetical protein
MFYSNSAHDPQAQDMVPVELPLDAVEYASDADAFFARANNPRWREKFKWAIITLWQQGGIGTTEAVWWLGQGGFIEADIHPEQAETALQAYVWFERHRAESGRALAEGERA